jgi:hypothetical protein
MGGRSHGNRNGSGDQFGNDRKANPEKSQEIADFNSYEQITDRLSLIQQDMKLEPGQLGIWLTFASKVRAYATDLAREKSRYTASASAFQALGLQHIAQSVDTARNHLTALEEVESAAKALYPTLKPDQKVLLDMRIPSIVAPRAILPPPVGMSSPPPDLAGSASKNR